MRLILTAVLLWGTVGLCHAADDIFDAARKGDTAGVKAALDAGTPIDSKWRYDQTALFIAAMRGHTEVVKLLLDRGADPNVRDSFYKMSALEAATMKNPAVAGLLAAKGAKGSESLLPYAAGMGNAELLNALMASRKWPQQSLDDALLAAETKKKSDLAAKLREAGAKPLPKSDIDLTALAGKYTIPNVPTPVSLEIQDGLLVINGLGQPLEFRPVDANTLVYILSPGTDKIVVQREGGQVKSVDYIDERRTIHLTREVAK